MEKIRRIYEIYPVDGVSTNPSILAKSGRDPYEVLREIRSIIGEDGELFVQATAADAEGMVKEAHRIVAELGKTTLVKIPCVPEGFKAMKQLRTEGIRFIGTAIYTPMQGYLAAKCGAEYVAPCIVLCLQKTEALCCNSRYGTRLFPYPFVGVTVRW